MAKGLTGVVTFESDVTEEDYHKYQQDKALSLIGTLIVVGLTVAFIIVVIRKRKKMRNKI